MTEQRKSKFRQGIFASLFNSLRSHTYRYSAKNIVQNRDAKLKRYSGSGNGTEVALEVLRDAHAQSCYDRLLEVMAFAQPVVTSGGNSPEDKAAVKFIEDTLINKHLEILVEAAAIAKFTGCAAIENNYSVDKDGKIFVKSITPIDSERLIYSISENSADAELRIQTINNPFDGEPCPLHKIVDFKYFSIYINNPYGLGIGSQLIDYVRYKERLLELWLRIAENYSAPVKIGNIPDTAEESEVDEFFQNFLDMSENATYLLPPGFTMSVVDVSATGVESLIKTLMEYCDERISTLILGENLTGKEISNGAQARDAVATKITERKALSQLKSIAQRLNETTITWLTQLNFPTAAVPTLEFVYEESRQGLADRLEAAKRIGVPLDMKKVAELLEVPYDEAKANKKILGQNISQASSSS